MTTSEAIQWAGGTQVLLGRRLGVSQGAISRWGQRPPLHRQVQIEALSAGALRADWADVKRGRRELERAAA